MEIAVAPIDSHAVLKEDMHNEMGFAHEPSSERFAQLAPDSLLGFWQFARINVSGLPSLVEQAIKRGVRVLDTKIPAFMWTSKAGHDDIGAVLYVRDVHSDDLGYCSKRYLHGKDRGLVARISFGPASKVDRRGWKFSNFGRLHIGSYAFRDFLPVPAVQEVTEKECLSEEISFPLRWLKNKKGIWQFDNPYTDGCMNQETRTPWQRLTKGEYYPKMVELSKRKSTIPFSQGLNAFGQEEKKDKAIGELFKVFETTHSGYHPILQTLSGFGEVKPSDNITEMTPRQGVEYLFSRVLPAMKHFINSK
ncbi:MAG: hypothetical protein AABX79_00830 [Nanoarchaeota archaeon]